MRIVDDPELHVAQMSWFNDGSALPLVSLHLARGETLRAAAVARAALSQPDCKDEEEIERLLFTVDDAPEQWTAILTEFAATPSVERWRDIMLFVPPELAYQRQRNSIRRLRQLGMDTNMLFLCACELGMTPDAIEFVEEGLVDSDVIVKRAEISGGALSTYLGLAATAAYLAGDIVGSIRLLRESLAHQNEFCIALPHIWFIREHASDDVNAALDQAGIPRDI
jgi:hypothetical protein